MVRADPAEQGDSPRAARSNLVTLPHVARTDDGKDEEGYGDWEDDVTRPTGPNPLLESAARHGDLPEVGNTRPNPVVPAPNNTNGTIEDDTGAEGSKAKEQALEDANAQAGSSPWRPAPGELAEVARIDPSGAVIHAADEATGDAVAYAARLASLVGELLGLESLRAMECASRTERMIVYTAADSGALVACRGALAEDASALRAKVGL
jgi:hypothetical protein